MCLNLPKPWTGKQVNIRLRASLNLSLLPKEARLFPPRLFVINLPGLVVQFAACTVGPGCWWGWEGLNSGPGSSGQTLYWPQRGGGGGLSLLLTEAQCRLGSPSCQRQGSLRCLGRLAGGGPTVLKAACGGCQEANRGQAGPGGLLVPPRCSVRMEQSLQNGVIRGWLSSVSFHIEQRADGR